MSPEEQSEQEVRLELDFRAAEKKVSQLTVKAKLIGENIAVFAALMKRCPERVAFREPEQHGFPVDRIPDEIYKAMKEWEIAFAVADQLRAAMRRLADLRALKDTLGLP